FAGHLTGAFPGLCAAILAPGPVAAPGPLRRLLLGVRAAGTDLVPWLLLRRRGGRPYLRRRARDPERVLELARTHRRAPTADGGQPEPADRVADRDHAST